MIKFRRFAVLLLLPLVLACFLSVGVFAQLSDTSVLSMSGVDWQIKVDGSLKTALDSATSPYIASKSATDKELFLQLNSLKDCEAGKVEFKVQMSGLSIYKQLPLDQELNKEDYAYVNSTHALNEKGEVQLYRPIDIVNSFACFDSDGRKVLHISASKLVDAKGNIVWVDSDLVNGVLTVYLDQKFLETASFPILVDPIFGYDTIGGSTGTVYNGMAYRCAFLLPHAAEITSLGVYFKNSSDYQIGIYANNTLLVYYYNTHPNTDSWQETTVYSGVLDVGVYYIGFKPQSTATFYYMYDTIGTYDFQTNEGLTNSQGLPTTWSVTNQYLRRMSIYANYTEYEESTPTPSPSPTPESMDDMTDSELWVSVLLVALVVINVVLIAVPFALVRFVFGALSLLLSAMAYLNYSEVPLAPYLQVAGLVVSVVCMFLAARARE